ncbi:succinate dehydrogenase assembly factor 3, mitochondrial [Neocloeon triangulifer]|uniref:succinate dehydrogenase assembly factor 3, mitochondrial n=1 Tax=Neocloeon triangulifer TaxID=2078957 RepID=UPI00286EC480|nr:succinate dehydrogenase assembly factor 3, mitochondrial [Neocloeon triangulifer]
MSASSVHLSRVRTLYKAIMRLHRGLPAELSELGTTYTRDEFKRHKSCTPEEAHVFMVEWSRYALNLAEQLGLKGAKSSKPIGNSFSEEHLDNFREDQIAQLYELKLAAAGESNDSGEDKNLTESEKDSKKSESNNKT